MLHDKWKRNVFFGLIWSKSWCVQKWTESRLCVFWVNWSLPAKPNVVPKPLLLISSQWLPRNHLYGRLVILPCILPSCTVIQSKGQSQSLYVLKLMPISFWNTYFHCFSSTSTQGLISDVDKLEAWGLPATGEGRPGLASHHSSGDMNLVYF